jgi:hypothetical protein
MMRLLILLAVLLAPTAVLAQRQCTVTGNVTIDSSDSYYCDTTWGNNCAGWREVNLDTVSQPMRFLAVEIWDLGQTTRYGKTHTLSNGSFSRTVLMPGNAPCAGRQIVLRVDMRRVHEDDLNVATPRYRFKVTRSRVNDQTESHKYAHGRTLTGDTTVANWHFSRVALGSEETEYSAVANLYYMTNSMLTQAVTWEPFIGFKFESTNEAAGGIYRIRFSVVTDQDPCNGANGCAPLVGWGVHVNNIAGNGMLMRHEVGHSVHQAIHGKQTQFTNCTSPNYGGSTGRDHQGCEWGSYITLEMFVNVLAYRSIVDEDVAENVWRCGATTSGRLPDPSKVPPQPQLSQDFCNACRANALADDDRIINCPNTTHLFAGIGDDFASSLLHCTRLQTTLGCNCPDTDANSICDDYQGTISAATSLGWRNPVNFERFLWDVLDANDEGALDANDLDIFDVVTAMYGMGYANSPIPWGADGTCWEHQPANGNCLPQSPSASVQPGSFAAAGTRDGYNARDFEDAIPGSQLNEMVLNCVQGAPD